MTTPLVVRNEIGRAVEARLAPLAGTVLEEAARMLREAGLTCAVEVEATARLRWVVPALPDPEVTASIHARGTWDGEHVTVDVISKSLGAAFVTEGQG